MSTEPPGLPPAGPVAPVESISSPIVSGPPADSVIG